MQENQDLILLPTVWWSSATETLEPKELVLWYVVSDTIRFKECKTCAKRIGEDLKTGNKTLDMVGCLKCPMGRPKKKHSNHRNQHGDDQTDMDKVVEVRQSLLLRTPTQMKDVCLEIDEDDLISSDGELDQETQQVHICVSVDRRRMGESGGEPDIISLEELRVLLITQQSLEDQIV